jgi:hypothetical protein
MPSLHRSPPVGSAIARDRYPRGLGDVAQLVEHLLCKQGVGGSSPLVSTTAGQRPWPSSSSAVAGTIGRAPTGWNGSRSAGRSTLLRDFLASVGYRGRDGLSPRLCEEGKVRGPLRERTSRRDGKRNHLFAVWRDPGRRRRSRHFDHRRRRPRRVGRAGYRASSHWSGDVQSDRRCDGAGGKTEVTVQVSGLKTGRFVLATMQDLGAIATVKAAADPAAGIVTIRLSKRVSVVHKGRLAGTELRPAQGGPK